MIDEVEIVFKTGLLVADGCDRKLSISYVNFYMLKIFGFPRKAPWRLITTHAMSHLSNRASLDLRNFRL